MKQGFIKVAAVTPKIKVADPEYNAGVICSWMDETEKKRAKIVVFPELCITGYTCQDLFLQNVLLNKSLDALRTTTAYSEGMEGLFYIGLPIVKEQKLYNVAAVIHDGEVLAFIPKTNLPNYSEFYEMRHFSVGNEEPVTIFYDGREVPFGTNILLESTTVEGLMIGCELCEDVWVPDTPSTSHACAGATIIVNLSASDETVTKDSYRKSLVQATSARLLAGYIYASAGEGESTQDVVFSGHNLIAENGTILAESVKYTTGITLTDIDVNRLCMERRRMNTFQLEDKIYKRIPFYQELEKTKLDRKFYQNPFVPQDIENRERRCEDILSIQANGLKKRYEHTGCRNAVIGISGGLDSTLALLVTARAFDLLQYERKQIVAITMPCFGTTDRTYRNACALVHELGVSLREIDIRESVTQHFNDIKQDMEKHDVTYENGQARERTQILMDIANQTGGLVIGTGDMSELALGWATYNGDHMSMYGVNAGVPKTLVRYLVQYYAKTCGNMELQRILKDVLDTPVSPELLPPTKGDISQKTEDIVGPYELHDFFLYYMLRMGYEPAKVYRIALEAFYHVYSNDEILKWIKIFYHRFFAQQFKRSCLPDGPKVGSVALSPRGDLRMPSDASAALWMKQLENL